MVNKYSEDRDCAALSAIEVRRSSPRASPRVHRCTARAQRGPLRLPASSCSIIQKSSSRRGPAYRRPPAKRTSRRRASRSTKTEALERAAASWAAPDALNLGGRFVAMSYHSLKRGKIVKRLYGRGTSKAPEGIPCGTEELKPTIKIIARGARRPEKRTAKLSRGQRQAALTEKIEVPPSSDLLARRRQTLVTT